MIFDILLIVGTFNSNDNKIIPSNPAASPSHTPAGNHDNEPISLISGNNNADLWQSQKRPIQSANIKNNAAKLNDK